ncbi:sulfotransferase domain-containing protein [Thiohalorhabdus methylotrophus]|uniref:Sulfotransferase domain-containing protein n=1 Tax=Thiohalorhabdus methylotrophus TaxID=3242694 RepID=A0ABV4TWM6_9GAMM
MLKKLKKQLRRSWLHHSCDTHIISFPKCGRTWLVLMISKAIEEHYGVKGSDPLRPHRYKRKLRRLPKILPHHDGGPEFLEPEELETDKSAYSKKKVIFLVRDPRDVTVSAYFQKTKRNPNFHGTLEEYVYEPRGSIESNIAFYNIWARNRQVPRDFLLLTYENMQENAHQELRRVMDFMGLSEVSNEALEMAVEFCRFENMRKMESSNSLDSKRLTPRDSSDETTYKTREGRSGGYVDYLDAPEIGHINRLIAERLDPYFSFYYGEPNTFHS